MATTKKYLPFPLFLLSVSVVGFGIWYLINNTVPPATPTGIFEVTPSGTVSLEASPAPTRIYLGDEVELDINTIFEAGSENLTAVQLELTFDPTKLAVLQFLPTTYLPSLITAPTITNGRVFTALGTVASEGGRNSWGTVGEITVKSLALGSQQIDFGAETLVSGMSSGGNILQAVTPISIDVFSRGDLNYNKVVDIFDFNELVLHFGDPHDIFDFNDIVAHYGEVSP